MRKLFASKRDFGIFMYLNTYFAFGGQDSAIPRSAESSFTMLRLRSRTDSPALPFSRVLTSPPYRHVSGTIPPVGSLVICPGVYPLDRTRSQRQRKTPASLVGVALGVGIGGIKTGLLGWRASIPAILTPTKITGVLHNLHSSNGCHTADGSLYTLSCIKVHTFPHNL